MENLDLSEPLFSDEDSDFALEDIVPSLDSFDSLEDHEYMLFNDDM